MRLGIVGRYRSRRRWSQALRRVGEPQGPATPVIWVAPDATALHAAVASLPLFAWMDVSVTPLATHPLET